MRYFYFNILLMLLITEGCAQNDSTKEMKKRTIDEIFIEYSEEWLSVPGVQGFYQGFTESGEESIFIMVDKYSEEEHERLPESVEGYKVIIEEVGVIKPLNNKSGSPEE